MFELKHKHHFQVAPQCVRTSLKERQNPIKLKNIRFPCTLLQHIIRPVKQKNCDYFLIHQFNMCFGCSKEPSHRDGSFEYPQHMFWLRNKKIIFSYTLLSGGLIHTSMSNSSFFFLLFLLYCQEMT